MAKRKSTRLENFTPEQYQDLADDYPTIRRELDRLTQEGLTKIQLPEATGSEQQLAVLRDLEAKKDLYIRISYAGNLNVLVRGADEELGYLGVIRRPATDWCVPNGHYFP